MFVNKTNVTGSKIDKYTLWKFGIEISFKRTWTKIFF